MRMKMRYNPHKQNKWRRKKDICPNDRIDVSDEEVLDRVEMEEE